MMLGQLEEQQGATEAARAAYSGGLKRCADCVPLWRAAGRLEEAAGSVGRARALLEQVGPSPLLLLLLLLLMYAPLCSLSFLLLLLYITLVHALMNETHPNKTGLARAH